MTLKPGTLPFPGIHKIPIKLFKARLTPNIPPKVNYILFFLGVSNNVTVLRDRLLLYICYIFID